MEFLKRWYQSLCNFCNDVVCWRNIFTVPYVMAINFTFCIVAFYFSMEKQVQCLYGLVALIISTDLLFSSTRDHSIMYEIVTWPMSNFFKTSSVALCSLAVYELKNSEKEDAFVSAAAAVFLLIVDPVYKYQKINQKLLSLFTRLGQSAKYFLSSFVVYPLIVLFKWVKFIVLFQWVNVLLKRLRIFWDNVYAKLDTSLFENIRIFSRYVMDVVQYWVYFHWWTDLRLWSKRVIFDPLLEKLTKVLNAFIYVVGCYWLVPLLQQFGRFCKIMGVHALSACKELLKLFGVHVMIPIFGIMYAQLQVIMAYFYYIAIQPMVDMCHDRYKFLEDLCFIHVLGPLFKRLLDCVPEQNPFCEISDTDLADFLPSPQNDDDTGNESDDLTTRSLGASSVESDMKDFVPRGLNNIDISCSDSSDAEFALVQRSKIRRSKRNQRGGVSRLADLNFEESF